MFKSLKRQSSANARAGNVSPPDPLGKDGLHFDAMTINQRLESARSAAISCPIPAITNYETVLVRLINLDAFYGFAEEGAVPFYEIVPSSVYVEVKIEEFLSTYAKQTVAVSWRWNAKKPDSQREAEAKLRTDANPCQLRVVQSVKKRLEGDLQVKYVWIDWCCAPQFGLSPIPEVSRSGLYFKHAGRIVVCCFESDGDEMFDFSDYFSRTWTLAERLYRSQSPSTPLCARDVLPMSLIEAVTRVQTTTTGERKPLKLDASAPAWGVLMASAMAKLRLSSSVNSQGGFVPEVVKEFVAETVCGRYPLLRKSLSLIEENESVLAMILTPMALGALSLILRVRAIEEWSRFPDPADDVCQMVQFTPRELKEFIFEVTLRQAKSHLSNLIQGQIDGDHANEGSRLIDLLDGFLVVEETLNFDDDSGLDVLDNHLMALLDTVLDFPANERPSRAWLRQYMLHASAKFNASFEPDKVFSLYKLFSLHDRSSYEEVENVWRDMAVLAKLERTPSEVFGWVRDMAIAPLKHEEDSLEIFFAENERFRPDLSSFDPRNFGVFAFPPLFCRQQLTMESLLLHADVAQQMQAQSYLVSFSMDERAAAKLSKKCDYKLVTANQEDPDSFPADERLALSRVESKLHDLIRRSFSLTKNDGPFVTKTFNGLFVMVRVHGVSQLAVVLVMRTACYSQEQWTLECIGGFTTPEPVATKSTRGIAAVLQNLVKDILALDSDLGVSYSIKHRGTCAPFIDPVLVHDPPPHEASDKAKKDDSFVSVWELNGDYNPDRGESTFHGGLLLKKHSMDVGDLTVFGKTTFDRKTEFNRLQKASELIALDQGSQDALAKYYHLLQRNYVHDTIMARRIDYFGELCEVLTQHIEMLPALLGDGDIRQSVEYFCEDMQDALGMAQADSQTVEKARVALDRLSVLLRE